jgi:tyrosyl-tRNA synthetase
LADLLWRGLIHDSTDQRALREALDGSPLTFYVGFDPTAPSLHVGSLVQLVTARRLRNAGHRPLLLVGGSTGLIGDPSGRSSERQLNSADRVASWVGRLRTQISRFLPVGTGDPADPPGAALLVNNLDWAGPLSAIEFLRDVGKHFPITQMLNREVVSSRLGAEGISYTEFSYQLLQAFDFQQLNERYGCTLQFGGSDQWGNITAGLDYLRRRGRPGCHAFTTPLLTKADGTKFGKTAGGSVWLDADLTSPYAFYQYWLNADDRDIGRLLRVYSERPRDDIEALEREAAERPAGRAAQRALAEELTILVHGSTETAQAITASGALFGRGELVALSPAVLRAALAEAGLAEIALFVNGSPPRIVDLFREVGLVASISEGRRTIAEGGAYVNNLRVTDPAALLEPAQLLHGRWLVLRRGRRNVAGIEVAPGSPTGEPAAAPGFDSALPGS